MLFHVSLSHDSLTWPCQFFWFWHWRSPCPSTHPCSPSSDSWPSGTGCPKASLQVSADGSLSRCRSRELAELSAVPKPEDLLELRNEEDMEIETGEAASWARMLLGQLWKDNPARVTTLFIGSLRETYMVSKGTSSHHKTKSHLFVARQSTTELTETTARHGKYSYFSPRASQDVGFKETAYSISYQGGRHPTKGEGLPQGHPVRPPERSLSRTSGSRRAPLRPEPWCSTRKVTEQPGPGIF